MLSIILDISGGYLVAKFVKNIWYALIAAIAVGIASSVIVNLLIYSTVSDVITTEEIILGFALGVYLHPIITIVAFFIFRKIIKSSTVIPTSKSFKKTANNKNIKTKKHASPKTNELAKKSYKQDTKRQALTSANDKAISTTLEKDDKEECADDNFYLEKALIEYESGDIKKGMWAKAFSKSDGDETKAKAIDSANKYIILL